jgi:two-component system, sensor histidine kinase and response regulator
VKPKILLVEDEEENQLLGMTLLKGLEADVSLAKNGAEALAKAYEQVPDLILLDIMMPVMTGLQVLEKLRVEPKTTDIAVIMLTSLQRQAEFEKAKKLGAKGFLSKPYEPDAFLSRVCLELGIPKP